MGQLGADVSIEPSLGQAVEIIGKAFPVERHARCHHHIGNVFHALHQLDHELMILGPGRGKADTAISHDDRGHAMVRRRRKAVLPGDLSVVMGMDIDEAGGNDPAGSVDLLRTPAIDLPHLHDGPALDRDIGLNGICAGAIVNGTSAHYEIVFCHVTSP